MLPKNLKYGNKVESASATAYTSNIAPQNGTGSYGPGQTIIINIPCRNNLCLIPSESVLKFSLTVTNGGTASNLIRLDRAGASGVIERLRLYSGSNLIEDVSSYGLLVANLLSLQSPNGAVRGKMNISSGLRNDNIVECFNTAAVTTTTSGKSYICPGGEKLWSVTEDAVIAIGATTISRTYTISLLSILGSLSSQYIPLFAMASSGPLRLEIQLADSPNRFICSHQTLSTFKLDNVEYIGSFLELSDQSMEIINASLMGQPLQFVVPSYRNYVFTQSLPIGGAQINVAIASKFSSLKSLFCVMRDTAQINTATFFPFSSTTFGLSQYNLRVGSKLMPSKSPASIAEFFSEACKAIGSISDLALNPSMNMFSYSPVTSTANAETNIAQSKTSCSNNFIIGVDLETYAASDKDKIFSGYNCLSDDIFLQLQLNGTGAAVASLRFDTFSLFDSLIICENGTAYVKF